MLSINISELILTFVSFYIMLLLLKKFLFKPIVKFMDERQARIDAGLEKEKMAEEKLSQAQQEHNEALELVKAQAAAHVEKGNGRHDRALRRAQDSLNEEKQRVEELKQIENQELFDKNREKLNTIAPELSRTLAGKLLGK